VASVDAQINLILKGVSELKKLSSALDAIENTATSIQDLFNSGVFGRVSDINTYVKALGQIEKTAAATRLQAAAIADVNAETKRALIVESRLRRERSRTARLSRAFEIETKGLDQTKGKLREIKEQFDEVSVALKSAFKLGDVRIISQLRNELSALVEDQREWNRTLAGTKNTGINADFLKEQARGYAQQIEQLRKRALALSENEEIIRRLAAAEFNLVKQRDKNTGAFTQFADPRLGRELLSNIKAQITAEEQLARERERFSGQYERQQKEARRQAVSTAQTIAAIARKAGGATFDALTFGQGAKVARGARNVAIRGGLGIGALGLGGAYAATQEALGNINLGPIQGPAVEAANAIGGAINNALGGVPAIINDMLSALGNVPGSLGLASVAALAFAPAMKTAADAVFLAGKRFGATKFGENIKLTLDRQTNLFESVINKASEMNMVLDASRSGLDAVGKKIETLPALPAAGQTAFAGPMRRGRGGAFIGGGARELLSPEFLATATGAMAQRTQEAADTSLLFAEGLGQAATEAKTIAEYLKQANELRAKGESSTQRFIRQTIERGRIVTQGRQSAEIARERSAFLTGSSYSLSQVPARGELFPGGRTETAQSAYRELLNTTARINQLQQDLLQNMSKQQGFSATIGQLERRTINDKGRSLVIQQQENEELQRSVQIIRERNKELRQRPIAAMTPQERVSQGILDPESLRANRKRRIEIGRLDPLERFYAGFQPRRLAARSARATSEGLVGGAFPLLFGQGLGAAVGGGAGGALGGFAGGSLGFGLSLAGTALGTAFDTLNQAAQDTGKALRYPTESFDKLKEAGLFASRQQEYYISKLIEAGRSAEAAAQIQSEIIGKIGVQGYNDLVDLGDSANELSKKWAELNYQMQALIAGPVGDLLNLAAKVVGAKIESNKVVGIGERIAGLNPEQRKAFVAEVNKLRGEQAGISAAGIKAREEILAKIAPIRARSVGDSPEEQERILDQAIQKADRIRSLNEQWISLQRSADDIRRSNEEAIDGLRKRAVALEKEAADFRRSIEDQIADKRLEVAQKLYDNERAIRQLSIDALDIQLQRAAGGLDPIAASIADAAREYVKIRDEGQADIERSEIQLALDLQRIENETNRQKIQIEDRVYQMTLQREEFANDSNKARMQLERQSLDYAVQVEKYRLDMTKYRYDMEIDLEKKKKIAAEGGLTGVQLNEAGIPQVVLGSGVAASVPMMTGVGASGEKAVQEELAKRGYNPAQMAAIMGSVRQESTFNPYAQEKGGTGRGLFQWSFGRAAKVPAFTGDYVTDIKNQIDLFEQELRTSEKKAGEMLARATTLDQAAAAMKQFERYGVAGKRYDYMRDYFSRFTGGAGTMPPVAAIPPAAAAAPGVPTAPPTAPVSPAMSLVDFPATPSGVQYLDLIEQITEAQVLNAEAAKEGNNVQKRQIELRIQAAELALQEKVLSPLRQYQEQNRQLDFELEKRKERNRLLTEGVKPEIVEGELRVLEISRALNSVLQGLEVSTNERTKAALAMAGVDSELVDSTFRLTEATLASLVATAQDVDKQKQLREQLESILKLRNELAGKAKGAAGAAAAGARDSAAKQAEPGLKIQDFIAQATAELNDLDGVAIRVSQGIGDAVGNSLANGITGLIEGTTTAKEIFANFLKDVGQILIREGAKMIATYIAIGIAKQFAGLFTQSSAAKNFEMPDDAFIPKGGFKFPGAANGAYFDGGMSYFANGGIVTSPTLFQFADGGIPRMGLMGEAGPEAIMPLKRGVDGKLGVQVADNRAFLEAASSGDAGNVPATADEESVATVATRAAIRESERLQENRTQIINQQMEHERRYERERIEQMASTPGNLNIRYESQVINSVEYVTREQAERMAAQSALRGRELAIGSLQNSVKTRKRVGMA
jgi:hypothetical protein